MNSRRAGWALAVILVGALVYWLTVGFGQSRSAGRTDGPQSLAAFLSADADGEHRQVVEGTEIVFPDDHGAHPEFRQEWWYFTGNLRGPAGQRYGYQLTFFRFAGQPRAGLDPSGWNNGQTWMSHFAITDVDGARFEATDTFARGGLGLAGAEASPFSVWVNGWSARGEEPSCTTCFSVTLQARHEDMEIDLALSTATPPLLHGDNGFSAKNPDRSIASYYYSLPDLKTSGTVRVGDKSLKVSGVSWMDREWSSAILDKTQTGWDWFALHLDDGRKLMLFQVRAQSGDSYRYGVLYDPDQPASRRLLTAINLEPEKSWVSSESGGRYPIAWELRADGVDMRVESMLRDQELALLFVYYEGAVTVQGSIDGKPAGGVGYMELTGYTD